MHILLGLLGSSVTILVLLRILAEIGVDFGGLNPFARQRRRAWRQKFEANPIFALNDPREMAAVLVMGVAKIDGDLSAEEKRAVHDVFATTFSLASDKVSELLNSTVFLLGDMQVIREQLTELLDRYREHLTPAQIESLLAMIDHIAMIDGAVSEQQRDLIAAIKAALVPTAISTETWG